MRVVDGCVFREDPAVHAPAKSRDMVEGGREQVETVREDDGRPEDPAKIPEQDWAMMILRSGRWEWWVRERDGRAMPFLHVRHAYYGMLCTVIEEDGRVSVAWQTDIHGVPSRIGILDRRPPGYRMVADRTPPIPVPPPVWGWRTAYAAGVSP